MIITIDGPSAAGKSSVAGRLADVLGFSLLDSGALYRAVAFYCKHESEAINEIRTIRFELDFRGVRADGFLLPDEDLRSPDVGMMASKISAIPEVREALIPVQRDFAVGRDIVAEGRDMGSAIFPNADLKLFLTADFDVRILRRLDQLESRGISCSIEEVSKDVRERDERDSSRKLNPLVKPEGAIEIDATGLSLDKVVEVSLNALEKWKGNKDV